MLPYEHLSDRYELRHEGTLLAALFHLPSGHRCCLERRGDGLVVVDQTFVNDAAARRWLKERAGDGEWWVAETNPQASLRLVEDQAPGPELDAWLQDSCRRCGHSSEAHRHFSTGRYCSLCESCRAYKRRRMWQVGVRDLELYRKLHG